MNSKLGLFRGVAVSLMKARKQPSRKLYTDTIYPYPFNYFNNEVYPSQVVYRETFIHPPWVASNERMGWYLWRMFWTIFWFQLLNDPGVFLGHFNPPDPLLWTDAELGIPPDEFGSYYDWLEKKESESC